MSAAALNYPVPTLLNWNANATSSPPGDSSKPDSKIPAIGKYLDIWGPERDNDLILILDGYNTMFQLRPGNLVERWFEVQRKANARIEERLGSTAMVVEGISQKVVFGARKNCQPNQPDDVDCYAVPPSMLPEGVYGPDTDKAVADERQGSQSKFRERYLDTGFKIGEMAAMKKLYGKAAHEMGSEETMFPRIFGEQEYQREVIRERYRSTASRYWYNFLWFFGVQPRGILDPHPTHKKMDPAPGCPFEYGIGLDYEGLLGSSTAFAEKETEFIRYNDTKSIGEATRTLKMLKQKVWAIPEDITRSPAPFWSPNGRKEAGFPEDLDWDNIPLYTNMWTGVVPASVHHDPRANEDRDKALKKAAWDKAWYSKTKSLRALMDLHINEPYKAFVTLKEEVNLLGGGGGEVAWWPMHEQKWATRTDIPGEGNEFVGWEETCEGFEGELFNDGKGVWKPPRLDY
jgi:hypothetical protein